MKIKKRGFTIVELSIVIAVIAILSAVLIPTFTSIVKNAKNSAAIQDAQNAYTQYVADTNLNQEDPASDAVYKIEDGKYVALDNGKVKADDKDAVCYYDTVEKAVAALGYQLAVADDPETEGVDETQEAGYKLGGEDGDALRPILPVANS